MIGMKIIKIDTEKPEQDKIEFALNLLRDGGTVVYPTDTIYGLGVNIYDENAIKKVFYIKKRSFNKPLSVCLSQISDINRIAYLDKTKRDIINEILPGPFTIILRKKEFISKLLTAGGEKIGIRIPNNRICMELTKLFPITTTSANLSGKKPSRSVNEVVKQLDDSVDLILDTGKSENELPSTVIDLTLNTPKVVREGSYKLK
jgi:L-threonylcarbamoyladenylate synthase